MKELFGVIKAALVAMISKAVTVNVTNVVTVVMNVEAAPNATNK